MFADCLFPVCILTPLSAWHASGRWRTRRRWRGRGGGGWRALPAPTQMSLETRPPVTVPLGQIPRLRRPRAPAGYSHDLVKPEFIESYLPELDLKTFWTRLLLLQMCALLFLSLLVYPLLLFCLFLCLSVVRIHLWWYTFLVVGFQKQRDRKDSYTFAPWECVICILFTHMKKPDTMHRKHDRLSNPHQLSTWRRSSLQRERGTVEPFIRETWSDTGLTSPFTCLWEAIHHIYRSFTCAYLFPALSKSSSTLWRCCESAMKSGGWDTWRHWDDRRRKRRMERKLTEEEEEERPGWNYWETWMRSRAVCLPLWKLHPNHNHLKKQHLTAPAVPPAAAPAAAAIPALTSQKDK